MLSSAPTIPGTDVLVMILIINDPCEGGVEFKAHTLARISIWCFVMLYIWFKRDLIGFFKALVSVFWRVFFHLCSPRRNFPGLLSGFL